MISLFCVLLIIKSELNIYKLNFLLFLFIELGPLSVYSPLSLSHIKYVFIFLLVLDKVQPKVQGVQPEVVPVAPSSQSTPAAPPQVYFVLHA